MSLSTQEIKEFEQLIEAQKTRWTNEMKDLLQLYSNEEIRSMIESDFLSENDICDTEQFAGDDDLANMRREAMIDVLIKHGLYH